MTKDIDDLAAIKKLLPIISDSAAMSLLPILAKEPHQLLASDVVIFGEAIDKNISYEDASRLLDKVKVYIDRGQVTSEEVKDTAALLSISLKNSHVAKIIDLFSNPNADILDVSPLVSSIFSHNKRKRLLDSALSMPNTVASAVSRLVSNRGR